jgi:alpha-2-macroglobulin
MDLSLVARRARFAGACLLLASMCPSAAWAQESLEARPAFTLSSSHIFSTRETPAVYLTFRRVTFIDFRVYRVNDPLAFFRGLRDPHQLGSEEPIVPKERTLIERLADWKAARREDARNFVRAQFSHRYRTIRRERAEQQQVQLRKTVRFNNFAQVPLLNPSRLVSSWREIVPPVRDTESRRVPLEAPGPGVYVVEAVNATLRAYTVVIVSDVGLVTKAAPGQLLIFAANRFSGEPLSNCAIDVMAGKDRIAGGQTGADGVLQLATGQLTADDVIAVARCGGQTTASDPGSWLLHQEVAELAGYVYTDKPIYRPGHTVHTRAVLRWRRNGALAPFDRPTVEVVVSDQNDKVVVRQTRPVDEFGSVHATFALPRSAALGYYSIKINSEDATTSGSFEVQEYRKPEFEVVVRPSERFVVQGSEAHVTITARYYFGQPVAGGTVKYVVHKQPYYSPLRWTDGEDAAEMEGGDYSFYGEETSETAATLNDQGALEVAIPLDVEESHQDYSARIEARVTDSSSREVSGDTIVHATYTRVMLAGSTDRYVYAPGARVTLAVRALDYAGTPQANQTVNVWAEHIPADASYEASRSAGRQVAQSTVETDAEGRAVWTMTLPNDAGTYLFKSSLRVGDRAATDTTWVWVSGASAVSDEDQYLELVADKKAYQPGETARFALRGGRLGGTLLITKENQVVSYYRVDRTRASASDSFEVPITPDDIGDTYVNLAFITNDRLFRAEKRVAVPATSRQLTVTIAPDQPVSKPQQPGTFTLTARDAAGAPVRAQISVGVIDEAVYAVRKDDTPDPLRFFYRREYSRVGTQFSRDYAFVGYSGRDQLLLTRGRRRPLALADFKADKPVQPQVRKDFPDAIYWSGDIVTNDTGQAKVELKYPDALTTWRLTARAVTKDTMVGSAVARTTTTKDLIVRVITPRFLTEGDEVVVPAIVHNYLPSARNVEIAMKAAGVSTLPSVHAPKPTTFSLAQGREQRLDYRFVSNAAGTASFTANATTDADADAVELSIPVLPYGLERRSSQAGSIAGAGEQSISLDVPDTANPAWRTIDVGLAPSLAGSLFGALDFLTSFPYGCTEQTLSSFLPNVLVTRALADLKLAPTERLQVLDRQVSDGLRRLYDYQHEDGGWGWWKADQNHPFMTAYALYGLAEARQAGYRVEDYRIRNGTNALVQLYATYPRAVPDLKAYMVYVLQLVRPRRGGATEPPDSFDPRQAIDELWNARGRMSPYGRALMLLTLDAAKDARGDQVASELLGSVQTTGDLAFWRSERDPLLEDEVETSVEATAFAVKALAARDPKNPVLERAVRWMLLNRNGGWYWSSTKQTAMVLYGLLDFMRARGELGTAFDVDVYVNGTKAGGHAFTAAELTSPDPIVISAPAATGANSVRLVKRGGGALYWSATAHYYETKAPLAPGGSRQLALVREYFTLTPVAVGKRIVYRESPFAGTAAPGDVLLVRLTVAGSRDWRYLMLEDPLPAGAEPIAREDAYPIERRAAAGWWYGSQREFRDDRAVFFQESFGNGRSEYQYLLKVVTPGVFRAMPARIAPMYVPGVTASTEPRTFTIAAPGGASR